MLRQHGHLVARKQTDRRADLMRLAPVHVGAACKTSCLLDERERSWRVRMAAFTEPCPFEEAGHLSSGGATSRTRVGLTSSNSLAT
eukprot:3508398-Rhodomonas_salina.1